jgi:hypothetical protein
MKRCSTCNRTYTDPNLSFCIDDGTPLTTVEAEDEATVVSPRGNSGDWSTAPYQPPRAYVPPGGEAKKRRAWPWILGIVGAFILGVVALSLAAALLAPKLIRRQLEQPPPRTSNTNQPANTNSNTANENVNQNANETIDTPPPTDHAQVLAQLTDIENDWTAANLNADKQKLDRILADDFVGESDGGPQSKADYIRTIERNGDVDRWDFGDLKLTLVGDRATLAGTITYVLDDRQAVFDFTDKFVWRDGRWQATGAEIKRREMEPNVNN